MTLAEFKATLESGQPPASLTAALRALWLDGAGNWDEAHQIAQDVDDDTGAWVHAYLHRKEGDIANAGYWYRRAGRAPSREPLPEEWEQIVAALLVSG